MKKKLVAVVAFVFICFGSVVFAGQNSNSSTTMQGNNNMGGTMGGHRRRHHRRHHRRHGRRGRMGGSKNDNHQ